MTRQERLSTAKQSYLENKDWSKIYVGNDVDAVNPQALKFWEGRKKIVSRPRFLPSVLPPKQRQLFQQIKH